MVVVRPSRSKESRHMLSSRYFLLAFTSEGLWNIRPCSILSLFFLIWTENTADWGRPWLWLFFWATGGLSRIYKHSKLLSRVKRVLQARAAKPISIPDKWSLEVMARPDCWERTETNWVPFLHHEPSYNGEFLALFPPWHGVDILAQFFVHE